jgi:hypothetical protein
MKVLTIRDFSIVVPAALILGAGLELIQPGASLKGWLGTSGLLILGITALFAAWRWAGAGKMLAWMTMLAFVLRLGAGVAAYLVLPIDGYNEPDDKAGFVFTDAHRRDDQAWQLASAGKPLWLAFDKTYYTDQYGGLLALSAIAYKAFSPDMHRPLLILALAALTAALGVPFFFAATGLSWGPRLAALATWLFAVYPESVLTGGAQMREPFLLTLIAVTFYGFAHWIRQGKPRHIAWMALGLVGMLLVSPAIALVALVLFGVWWRIAEEGVHARWPVVVGAGIVLIAGVAFLGWSMASRGPGAGSISGILGTWVKESVSWVVFQLESGSGQIQNVFSRLSPAAQFLFVVGYGVTQPVLPPAFFEPTTLTWHLIAILRATGWYVMLPLLVYAPVAVRQLRPGGERRVWSWLAAFSWVWILVCAIRAGGDQWDNPRYRLIFFSTQAAVAAFAWLAWREHKDSWLPRILAAEGWCVLVFSQWYVARYYVVGVHFPILVVLSLCIVGLLVILVGGAVWDARKAGLRRSS